MNELDPLFEENEMLKKVVLEQSARINEMRAALREIKDQYLTPQQSSAIAKAALAGEPRQMSDLVKRIRDYSGERIGGSYELREQAAARIEALEAALRETLERSTITNQIIRAALAEGQDK